MQVTDWPSEILDLLRRHNLLAELIVRIIRAEAVECISLPEDEVLAARQALAQKLKLKNSDSLDDHLTSKGISVDDALWQLTLPLRIRQYCEVTYGPKVEARFLDRKSDLDNVVYSLLRVKDEGLANELFLRLTGAEAAFADLAAEFSEGHEKATRGIIGPAPLSKAHPLLREQLRTADPGVVLPPIRIEDWNLVVRLESIIPATLDSSMQHLMAQELFEADVQLEVAQLLAQVNPQVLTPPADF